MGQLTVGRGALDLRTGPRSANRPRLRDHGARRLGEPSRTGVQPELVDLLAEDFDADGQVTKTVDGDGHAGTTLYDADGRATEHIDALNIPTFSYFDHDGQVLATVVQEGIVKYFPGANR